MNRVDLIIPTYNRPEFLHRILDYYNTYGSNFNIIVTDSSAPTNKKRNKIITSMFSKLNILYIDKFSQNLPSHKKYAEMVKCAESKYCVFCADDDFIIPNGIKKAVDFLDNNPNFSAAHGTYISFCVYNTPFGSKKFWWKFIYPYRSITSSNSVKRLASHLTNYYQVLWAVRRTDLVKNAYKELLKSKVDPYFFGELLPDILTLIYGKMKRLNTFYAARQAFSTSYSYWPSLKDAIKKGTYEQEYARFKNCLITNLGPSKYGRILNEQLGEIIDENMEIYLKTTTQEHLMGRVNLLLRRFPSLLSNNLRLLHAAYLFSKDKKDRIGSIANPSNKYFNDFDDIRQIVLKYQISS